jgi:hypothetical protein
VPPTRNWREVSILCLLGSVLFHVFSRTFADPDLWGHIKFGEDLWQTGRIVREDVYSYLSGDQLWINHEWLAEAIFYAVFAAAGAPGLIAFKTSLSLLITGLLYREVTRQVSVPLRAGCLVVIFSLSLIPYLSNVRPQAFTFLIFLLILIVLRKADRGEVGWLWLGPPLLALAVNLHGGVLASAGIFLLWILMRLALPALREKSLAAVFTRSHRLLPLLAMAAIAATLLNPYGIQLPLFLARTATVARPEISEWQPITLTSVEGFVYVLLLVLGLTGVIFSKKERNPVLIALAACTALLPAIASRHLPLFGLASAVFVAEHIGAVWDQLAPRQDSTGDNLSQLSWLPKFCLIIAGVAIAAALPNFGCVRIDNRRTEFPINIVALLQQSNASGNMAVHFDWGEYVLWHLGPQIKVSVDGRRETVYSHRPYTENLLFTSGLGDWDAILKGHETDLALVSKRFPGFNLMKLKPGWTLVYEDSVSGLFVRQGSRLDGKLRFTVKPNVSSEDAGLCFP